MVQYRDLNAPPSRMLADVVADMRASERQSKTGDAGVKDLGESGDVVWPRPDGTPVSVRDVDLDLADARQRIEDAETSLAENGARLTAAEQGVQDVRDDLAAIEAGEGGPLIHDRIPEPADGEGKPPGTAWLVYGVGGALTSVWQWDGTVWEEMPLDATLIPVLDIGSGTFGDLEGSRLTVDDLLAARVVQAMDLETKKLVVTEEAILNHATLIGQTVVDDINVQGKLVGTDGVFTGTVDFANVNVTGELLANEISGEHIYGTVVEGGEIRTTDGLASQVTLSDTAFAPPFDGGGTPRPGIRIDSGSVTPVHKPGVGPVSAGGIAVYSGQNSSNQWGALTVRGSRTEIMNDGGDGRTSKIEVSTGAIDVRMESATASSGARVTTNSSRLFASSSTIRADQNGVHLGTSVGGTGRSLSVDGAGVWATEGSAQVSLIPQVRPFQYSALWNMDLSPSPIMVQHLPGGKLCQAQARIQNLTGSSLALPYDTWVTLNLNPIPPDLRGGYTDYIDITHTQNSARGRLEMNYSTGAIRVKSLERDKDGNPVTISWTNNNSIWFPMRWFVPN